MCACLPLSACKPILFVCGCHRNMLKWSLTCTRTSQQVTSCLPRQQRPSMPCGRTREFKLVTSGLMSTSSMIQPHSKPVPSDRWLGFFVIHCTFPFQLLWSYESTFARWLCTGWARCAKVKSTNHWHHWDVFQGQAANVQVSQQLIT